MPYSLATSHKFKLHMDVTSRQLQYSIQPVNTGLVYVMGFPARGSHHFAVGSTTEVK